MTNTAVKIEHLYKAYNLGALNSGSFREMITQKFQQKILRKNTNPDSFFWALKDIDFEIKHGDIYGIIGKNGAGKSTLLKILSKITYPTKGNIYINGRVSSLLEVGTGFHPEMTGRENIFMNGSILGMKQKEIKAKFDQIVDFSGVEKFLDTPVKRYSSGMYVRLAFAVAAHLEPEILIIDEVLSVGDADFQKKSLGRMSEISKSGRTVLFVSHNMAAVQNLCNKGIVLKNGEVAFIGNQNDAVDFYLNTDQSKASQLLNRTDRIGGDLIKVVSIEITDLKDKPIDAVYCGQSFNIRLNFETSQPVKNKKVIPGISFKTTLGIPVFLHHSRLTKQIFNEIPEKGSFVFTIDSLALPVASYDIDYSLVIDDHVSDGISSAMKINVINGDFFGSGEVPPASHGVCLMKGNWQIER